MVEETIKIVEITIGRKLTEEELRVVRLAHLSAYDAGVKSVWDAAKPYMNLVSK